MTRPLFSVIVPAFNSSTKLERTLAAVLSQQQDLREVIVIDGGSTDGTHYLLQSYGESVRWLSEPDNGIYDAMNKGIGMAGGRFLYFCGAGDCLRPDVLSQIAPCLPDTDNALVYGNVWWKTRQTLHDGPFTKVKLTRGCLCHQAIFYGKDVFARHGTYDLRYSINADYVLNMRCFGNPAIAKRYMDIVVADYEGGGVSEDSHDANFVTDAPALIYRHLGMGPLLAYHAERMLPTWAKQGRFRALQGLRHLLKRGAAASRTA